MLYQCTQCVYVCAYVTIFVHMCIYVIVSMQACECVCLFSISYVSGMYTTYSVNCKILFHLDEGR